MDCNTARMLSSLRGNRADELPSEDDIALDRHIAACPDCQHAILREEKLDAPLRKAMGNVPIPLGLKSKILGRLAHDRGAWHRRRAWCAVAAAAAIIVAVSIYSWNPQRKAKFNLNELVYNTDQAVENPKVVADAWLASQGIAYELPRPFTFNPQLLSFHGLAPVQGKQVPMLFYRGVEDGEMVFAKVYFIRDVDFDLSNIPDPSGGSTLHRHQVRVFRHEQYPDKLAYVVLFNSRTLDPFLIQFSST